MLVTMQNSELINKLVTLADGDIDLVQRAIRSMSDDGKSADLKKVVNFIVQERESRSRVKAVA
jgi:hypothetical protein